MAITMKTNTSSLPITLLKMKDKNRLRFADQGAAGQGRPTNCRHRPAPAPCRSRPRTGNPWSVETDLIGASTAPAMPARPEPKAKIVMSILRRVDAEAARDRPVAAHRAHLEPEIGLENHVKDQEQQQDRHHDQEQPVPGKWQPADDAEAAFEDLRRADIVEFRSKDELDHHLQDDADAPGREQRLQWSIVDPLDDRRVR